MELDLRMHGVKQPSADDHAKRMRREGIPGPDIERANITKRFWVDASTRLGPNMTKRLAELESFYTDSLVERVLVPIVSVNSTISLRVLDWLVINYSRTHETTLFSKSGGLVQIYWDYREKLKHWKRCLFDAFRRGTRVYFDYAGHSYSTTPAQLNFLHWCITKGILEYAYKNIKVIEKHMVERISECRREKEQRIRLGQTRRRSDLSTSSTAQCLIFSIPTTTKFDELRSRPHSE